MNQKAKTSIVIVLAVIIGVILMFAYFGYGAGTKTLKEHAEPADISKEEEGQGMEIHFYDKDGNPVEIPDWFKVAKTTGIVGAIVEHPPAPTCTVVSDCPGVNPNVACWQNKCVLTNIASMSTTIKVTNGASFDFNDVYISSASPAGFAGALPTGVASKKQLPGGQTISWPSTIMDFQALGWVGTTQTFTATVQGTSSYDGSGHTSSDSITLKFSDDPTGAFSVLIETGVPK